MSQAPPSNLAVRVATVLVLAPLLLWLLFGGPVWGWECLIALASAQGTYELLAMTHPGDRFSRWVGAAMGALASLTLYLGSQDGRVLVTGLIVLLIGSALLPLFRLGQMETAGLRALSGIASPLYVGLLLTTLAVLRRDLEPFGARYVFLALTIAWMGDTGGYTFGRLFGKTKLYPQVSPKKTREGLLGSVVFSAASAALASLTYLPAIPLLAAVALGVCGALLGQGGDLVESLLKRSSGTKDSGAILPGHGGLLDRIDALLIVAPVVYLYALWTHH